MTDQILAFRPEVFFSTSRAEPGPGTPYYAEGPAVGWTSADLSSKVVLRLERKGFPWEHSRRGAV